MARNRPDRRQAKLAGLLPWVYRMTGLEEERVRDAAAKISGWPIPKLAARFGCPMSIDDAVRTVLLVEDVELLVSRDVPENKLMAKLKDVGQFEATWAEIRATSIIVTTSPDEVEVVLEEGKAQGKHADLRLIYTDSPHQSIEIKSVGLSAAEVGVLREDEPVARCRDPAARHGRH